MSKVLYCVYCTTYQGNKLPPKNKNCNILPSKYIGSTSFQKIEKGYRGSVLSKQYKDIWKYEVKNFPNLFQIEILSFWKTHEEAITEELRIQKEYEVVKNPIFVNKAYASINGFFGMECSGANHPEYGKKHSLERRQKHSNTKKLMYRGEGNPNFGKKASDETRQKLSKIKKYQYQGEGHPQFKFNKDIVNFIILKRNLGKTFKQIKLLLEEKGFYCSSSHIGNIYRKHANY